jgi:hypothetical protein
MGALRDAYGSSRAVVNERFQAILAGAQERRAFFGNTLHTTQRKIERRII